MVSAVQSTDCSCRRPESMSRHPHGSSQSFMTPVQGIQHPLLAETSSSYGNIWCMSESEDLERNPARNKSDVN